MKPTEIKEAIHNDIIVPIEKGETPPRRSGFTSIQKSGTTNKMYVSYNQLFLLTKRMRQKREPKRWGTFNTIKNLGGQIKKGEKGSMVIYFQMLDRKIDKEDGTTEQRKIPFMKCYYVWNLAQTTLPQDLGNDDLIIPGGAQAIMDNLLLAPEVERSAEPHYSPLEKNKIFLPPKVDYETLDQWVATYWHEFFHWMEGMGMCGEDNFINRKFGNEKYARRELVAEMFSGYMCGFCGVDSTRKNSSGYMSSWLEAFKKLTKEQKVEMLMKASGEAWKHVINTLNGKKNLLDVLSTE